MNCVCPLCITNYNGIQLSEAEVQYFMNFNNVVFFIYFNFQIKSRENASTTNVVYSSHTVYNMRQRSQGVGSRESTMNAQHAVVGVPVNKDPQIHSTSSFHFEDETHYEPMQTEEAECCECGSEACCDSTKRWSFIILVFGMIILLLMYLLPVALVFLAAVILHQEQTVRSWCRRCRLRG